MARSSGRRLQGAAFSGGSLHEQSPNDPEVAGVPDVTLAYVHKDKPRPYQVEPAAYSVLWEIRRSKSSTAAFFELRVSRSVPCFTVP